MLDLKGIIRKPMRPLKRIRSFLVEANAYFKANQEELTRRNIYLLPKMAALYAVFLLLFLFLVCLPQENFLQTDAVLIAIMCHSVLTVVAWSGRISSFRGFRTAVMLFGGEILSLALYLGIFAFPGTPAMLFPLAIVLMTQIYTIPPRPVLSLIGFFTVLFLVLASQVEPMEVFFRDLTAIAAALAIALVTYLSQLHYKLEASALRSELERMCSIDGMTGVLNKASFEDRADAFMCSRVDRCPFVLAIIDLDHFKEINDIHGHAYGDYVLSGFSSLLKAAYQKENCCIGRFGGDEFILLIEELGSVGQVRESFEKLFAELSSPSSSLSVSCSMGAVFVDQSEPSYQDVFSVADQALYVAKQNGRSQFALIELSDD